MINPKIQKRWEEFLNPQVLRPRLISAAIYIAAYESLKDAIVNRVRDFFCDGFTESADNIRPDYQTKVLVRNKSPLHASLDWLKNDMHAIDAADIAAFERIKNCRNLLAHQLLSMLGEDGLPTQFDAQFREMVELLHKIEKWWIVNVEIPTNPDLDNEQIDNDEIICGRVMMLQVLCDVALGDAGQSTYYYERLQEIGAKR